MLACSDVYSCVAALAARACIKPLVIGRLKDLSKEGGRFFDIAARYGCRCYCLDDSVAARPSKQNTQDGIAIFSEMSALKQSLASYLASVQGPAQPAKPFNKDNYRATQAELAALLGT
jgi:hypothetical protein